MKFYKFLPVFIFVLSLGMPKLGFADLISGMFRTSVTSSVNLPFLFVGINESNLEEGKLASYACKKLKCPEESTVTDTIYQVKELEIDQSFFNENRLAGVVDFTNGLDEPQSLELALVLAKAELKDVARKEKIFESLDCTCHEKENTTSTLLENINNINNKRKTAEPPETSPPIVSIPPIDSEMELSVVAPIPAGASISVTAEIQFEKVDLDETKTLKREGSSGSPEKKKRGVSRSANELLTSSEKPVKIHESGSWDSISTLDVDPSKKNQFKWWVEGINFTPSKYILSPLVKEKGAEPKLNPNSKARRILNFNSRVIYYPIAGLHDSGKVSVQDRCAIKKGHRVLQEHIEKNEGSSVWPFDHYRLVPAENFSLENPKYEVYFISKTGERALAPAFLLHGGYPFVQLPNEEIILNPMNEKFRPLEIDPKIGSDGSHQTLALMQGVYVAGDIWFKRGKLDRWNLRSSTYCIEKLDIEFYPFPAKFFSIYKWAD